MKDKFLKWIIVCGARPNYMKIAPLNRAIQFYNDMNDIKIIPYLVHTGQHYDEEMSDLFFREFDLPEPKEHLGVGSGSHGEQTGKALIEFEKVLIREKPGIVIVVGDVNSTFACALASVKLHIPVAHVEAGLRSFDRRMPEEINRILTDAISDYLFTPSPDGDENLIREGISKEKIFTVGNIMVDSLLFNLEQAKKTNILESLSLIKKTQPELLNIQSINPYALLTLHRPSNVDNKESLTQIIQGLLKVSSWMPILFSIHPRTRKQIKFFGIKSNFEFHKSPHLDYKDYYESGRLKSKIHCFEPFGYLDFLNLMLHAKVVMTDSGGIQEETTVLNVPCITLRDTTERPITLTQGTNILVKNDSKKIISEAAKILEGKAKSGTCPDLWDGHTAKRIIKILTKKIQY
jgi:UDP-N-acetylglucosamine 2-epimerase (non-hydrolysing)